MFTRIRQLLRRNEGSATLLVAMGATLLVASAGIAIDMGRVQTVQSRLSNALDSAGLAAGNGLNSGNVTAITNKYFWANFPTAYMGSSVNNPTVTASANNTILTLDVTGTVPTTFMKIFGLMNVPVHAHTQITRANLGMELVLVMDTTGSMSDSAGGGLTKLQAAKNAASDLINILYGTNATLPNMWVGLVPFAQGVNINASRTSWTSNPVNLPSYGWGSTSWGGCVDAREASNRDITDDPPATALFPKYYWPDDDNYNNWVNSSANTVNTNICTRQSSCTCANYGPCSCTTNGDVQTCISCSGSGNNRTCTRAVTTTTYSYTINSTHGPNTFCSQAVTPLTATKSTVLNAINSLGATGNTHIVLGAGWGWRMLSPRWRNLWGGEMNTNNLPLDYHSPLMNKVVILITDGDNTISNSVHGAYWYLSDGHLGTTNSTTATNTLNTRTQQVCTSMKNNGILVYTIAFGTDISATAQTMLQNCATSPDYYFYSPTGAALQTTFHTIADSLANLRVSQ
jgi:Flp pilus assembly protein TadG